MHKSRQRYNKICTYARKIYKSIIFSCLIKKKSVPLHRETQRRDVCASAEGFADILKRRLLRSVLTFQNVAVLEILSGLSNDRCPTGYRLSLLCLFWYVFCVYTYAHTRTLTIVARRMFIFGVGFALSVLRYKAMRQPHNVERQQSDSTLFLCLPKM